MLALCNFFLIFLSIFLLVPSFIVFLEIVMAGGTKKEFGNGPVDSSEEKSSTAVLMPAHNEAMGISASIKAVLGQLRSCDRLVVVADNCTDDTALVARKCGAEVIERYDPERRGKGYALDFGVRWLEKSSPAIVIVVDSDCIAQPNSVDCLRRACLASGRPAQALYLMHALPQSGLGPRIAEFAWLIKNKSRPLGGLAMGWPCQLMGSGMAFPWSLIKQAPLATGHLVEDMQLGVDLASAGKPSLFCPNALVTSFFPSDVAGLKSQRMRWEHGHISVLAQLLPRLILQALKSRNFKLLALGLDLMVPPLAALSLVLLTSMIANGVWWLITDRPHALLISLFAVALLVSSVMLAWIRDGHRIVSLSELIGLPWYVLSKIPMYLRLFTKRQVEWVRTKRD